MKFTIISDTHGEHEKLGVMSGEVLIHCGDMFNMFGGNEDDFERIDDWFRRQNFDLILCVGGNHDFELQKRSNYVSNPFKNAVFLGGASYEYEGVKFFGAPWVPDLYGQAFFIENSDLEDKWSEIPDNTDILITHTPPAGALDKSSTGLKLGCPYLAASIDIVAPRLHCFGHVHASSGILSKESTTYINASMVNHQYILIREPYEFQYTPTKT